MPTFEPFDVVAVPFPYVERETRKRRPTVVVSSPVLHERHRLAWVVMVTSAYHAGWPDDVPITDLERAGLPKPSIVRPVKLATVETASCERLGSLSADTADAIAAALRRIILPRH